MNNYTRCLKVNDKRFIVISMNKDKIKLVAIKFVANLMIGYFIYCAIFGIFYLFTLVSPTLKLLYRDNESFTWIMLIIFISSIAMTWILHKFLVGVYIDKYHQNNLHDQVIEQEFQERIDTLVEKYKNDKESFLNRLCKHVHEEPSENKYYSTINMLIMLTMLDNIKMPGEWIIVNKKDVEKMLERLKHHDEKHANDKIE
jgi:uncharacterized membrane protein YqjE